MKALSKITLHRKFYACLKKDMLLLIKRKKYLYLCLGLPFLVALLFALMLIPDELHLKLGVCDLDQTELSIQAFSSLESFEVFVIDTKACEQDLISAVKGGSFDVGVLVEKGFSSSIEDLESGQLVLYFDNTQIALAQLLSWRVDSSLDPYEKQVIGTLLREMQSDIAIMRQNIEIAKEYSTENQLRKQIDLLDRRLAKLQELQTDFLIHPVWTDKRAVYEDISRTDSGLAFVFPLIAFFVILMLSSTSFIYDKKTLFLTRLKSSTSLLVYLFAKLLFYALLAYLQFIIIFLVFLAFGASYSLSIGALLITIALIAISNTLIGLLIGMLSESEGVAVMFSLILAFPMLMLSGIFFPLQTMPTLIQYLASLLPLVHQMDSLQSVLLFSSPASGYLICLVLLVLTYVFLLRSKTL